MARAAFWRLRGNVSRPFQLPEVPTVLGSWALPLSTSASASMLTSPTHLGRLPSFQKGPGIVLGAPGSSPISVSLTESQLQSLLPHEETSSQDVDVAGGLSHKPHKQVSKLSLEKCISHRAQILRSPSGCTERGDGATCLRMTSEAH